MLSTCLTFICIFFKVQFEHIADRERKINSTLNTKNRHYKGISRATICSNFNLFAFQPLEELLHSDLS